MLRNSLNKSLFVHGRWFLDQFTTVYRVSDVHTK